MSKTFEITEGEINYIAGFDLKPDGNLQAYLKSKFPAAFEPAWEEVPTSVFQVGNSSYCFPLQLFANSSLKDKAEFKLEDGKIWRRKA